MGDAELVIPLHKRGLARAFPAISVLVGVAAVIAIAWAPSWEVVIWGVATLGWFIWISATLLAVRRVTGRAPSEIVATRESLRSPVWELDWERVSGVRIGYVAGGRVKALVVAPMRREDVRRPESFALRLNALASKAMRTPELQILEANVDMPLEDIAAEFERLAGRSLLV